MYQLQFKYDGMVYSLIGNPPYKKIDLKDLFHDFVFSRTLGGIIPLAMADEIVKKAIRGTNYAWL